MQQQPFQRPRSWQNRVGNQQSPLRAPPPQQQQRQPQQNSISKFIENNKQVAENEYRQNTNQNGDFIVIWNRDVIVGRITMHQSKYILTFIFYMFIN